MRRVASGFLCAALIAGCAKLPPPPKPPAGVAHGATGGASSKDRLGPLVRVGPTVDVLGPEDGKLRKDGAVDFTFRIRIAGPVAALALVNSDASGHTASREIWDTVCGATPVPAAFGVPVRTGAETATIAVVDSHGATLNTEGALTEPHLFPADGEIVTIYAPDPWNYFREGRAFTLVVVRPDGQVERSTVILVA